MRKTIIFGAIAALFGLAAVAQAASDQAKPAIKDDGQITQKAMTDGRGEKTDGKKGTEYRSHEGGDDAHAKGEEAHERGEREDRD